MELFDLPLVELKKYKPTMQICDDFDEFWDSNIQESKQQPLNIEIVEKENNIPGIDVKDIYYDGYRNSRLHGQLVQSNESIEKDEIQQIIVFFHGYNWNDLKVCNTLKYISLGFKVLLIDIRGQSLLSPDHNRYANGGPAGWMTLGMFDKNNYYYLYAFMDGVRAIEVAKDIKNVNPNRIIVEGSSQGGGMTLAVTALSDSVYKAFADIPFLCHYQRAIEIGNGTPYDEFSHYFKLYDQQHKTKEKIFTVLSYFDNVNLAKRIDCEVLISVGLADNVCPPSTIFAAYNNITSKKEILVFPNYGHGGFNEHEQRKIELLFSSEN